MAGTGVQYSLIFQDNSQLQGSVCVYQYAPDINQQGVMSLAWFAQPSNPTTRIVFNWNVNYDFVWAETGELVPGVMFVASQTWPADLSTMNQVTYSEQSGAYTFENQGPGPVQGTLFVKESSLIPANASAVGIGMSGNGTFVVQAEPNITASFTPHPAYWITFGSYTEGEVLNIQEITNPAQISFPVNVYSMTAILNADNTWTVQPTSVANKVLAAERRAGRGNGRVQAARAGVR